VVNQEQKISDAANCLCDFLTRQAASDINNEAFHSAPDLLHRYMIFLSFFRNHESQYFPPLQQKAGMVLTPSLRMPCLPVHDCSVEEITGHCGARLDADKEAGAASQCHT
jgi:hypothetical protein